MLLIKNGKVYPFKGEGIPGVVAIRGTSYRKNGKWSSTTYRLEVASGVRHICGKDGWETGRFAEGLASVAKGGPIDLWVEMANALGVTVPAAQEFLRVWRPRAAAVIDAAEAAIEELDEAVETVSDGTAETSVSFGSPTNRVMRAGFWNWPVTVSLNGETVGSVKPSEDKGWSSPLVEGLVRVIESVHSPGYHGGSVSLRLAVPEGAETHHHQPEEPTELPPPVVERLHQPDPPEPSAPTSLADLKARFGKV